MYIKNTSGRKIKINGSMTLEPGQEIPRKDLPLDDGDLGQCLRRGDLSLIAAPPKPAPKKKAPRKRRATKKIGE